MKKMLLTVLAFAAIGAVPALAADMAPRYTKAPVMAAPVNDWSGFYIGLNAGGAWSDNRTSYAQNPFTGPGFAFANCAVPAGGAVPAPVGPNPANISGDCSRPTSFIGGGQIGYNWQMGTWVYGFEADGAWQRLIQHSYTRFGANGSIAFGGVAGDTAYLRSEQGALGTFRGRIGYSPGPWLVYATGGLAVGDVKHSVTEVLSAGNACPVVAPGTTCQGATSNDTKAGWTIGAGFEWMFAPHWSVGAEYLYVDLGRTTINLPVGTGDFTGTSSSTFDDREHIARVKLNYHFSGPVVARY